MPAPSFFQTIPGWNTWENQGGGLALSDLDGSGRPDALVLQVDNPPGQNRGLYRVGRDLDAGGNATGGWGPWIDVPDWFSWFNQGGGIAVGDFGGGGGRDLVVYMIDAPGQQNVGKYRLGRGLDAAGLVAGGWTPWIDIPGWFWWRNQGAGVAVADLGNAGRHDVIFFQVDDAATLNQAFYKIARDVGVDGQPRGGLSKGWFGVPGWFSWTNQGGSIAVGPVSGAGKHDLAVLAIDAPPGENGGFLEVVALDDDPAVRGQWELLPYGSQLLAVHGAVLPGGKVLFFAGSGNSGVRFFDPDFGDVSKGLGDSVVWDVDASAAGGTGQFAFPATLRAADGRPVDYFCGGECFLADGRLLQVGGTLLYDVDAHNDPGPVGHGFFGRRDAALFDPAAGQWSLAAPMADGRWYPTAITLGDGRVLAVSGLNATGGFNDTLEIYTPDAHGVPDAWHLLPTPPQTGEYQGLPNYAHLFLLADGRVFYSGGRMDDDSPAQGTSPCLLDLTKTPVQTVPLAGLDAADSRNQSASVLLAPAAGQRVLIMGGATAGGEENATGSVDLIDLGALPGGGPLPAFQAAAPLLLPRVHLNAVLLPDRTVFVSGGALQREGGPTDRRKLLARLHPETYDPARDVWTLGAPAQVERLYHSIALLLPDGRVVAASWNPDKGNLAAWGGDDFNEELRLEIYSPPYLFKGPRPTITHAPAHCPYGATIQVVSPEAGSIRWASLLRPCVTTHSFDSGQRVVDLDIVAQGGGTLQLRLTPNPNLAPPGWYMLFLVDGNDIPSVAAWVRVG